VEHPHRVPQLYGYTVCLVALVVALASATSIVKNTLTMVDPTYHTDGPWAGWPEPSVTSFEAFRFTSERLQETRPPGSPAPGPVAEEDLRRRYEALRADRITRNRIAARRSLIISAVTFLFAVVLFLAHWRWLRRHSPAPTARAA